MSAGAAPRAYHRRPQFAWWWGRRGYTLFVVRELTSVFIGAYAVLLIVLVRRLGQGPDAYRAYVEWLSSPGMLLFHLVALAAAIYHSVTWFALSPKAMAVRLGGRRIPDRAVVGANVAAWLIISAILAWILLRG